MATNGKADVSKAMNAPKVRTQNYEAVPNHFIKVEGAIGPISGSAQIAAKPKAAAKKKTKAVKKKAAGMKPATKAAAKKKTKKKSTKKKKTTKR